MDKTLLRFKVENAKRKVKEKVRNVGEWVSAHPMETTAILTGVGYAAKATVKIATSHNTKVAAKTAERSKEMYWYDPSLGHYWKLRRPLTTGESIEVSKRRANGESLGAILEELRVLD